jgi:hypothetical protein
MPPASSPPFLLRFNHGAHAFILDETQAKFDGVSWNSGRQSVQHRSSCYDGPAVADDPLARRLARPSRRSWHEMLVTFELSQSTDSEELP